MIEYLQHHEIDREKWDTCIQASPHPKPYGLSWYLDIMSPGWEALMDDEYDSVFPVPVFRKYGISYIATPPFLQQLGLFSPDNNTRKKVQEIFDYMPEFYRFMDLCIAQYIVDKNYTVTPRNNFELDLERPYSVIADNYSSDCKRNIAKGGKNKPLIESSMTPKELIDHFRGGVGSKIKRIREKDYERLHELMEYCIKNKLGEIWGVRNRHNEWIYGIFVITFGSYVTLHFTSTSHESRERRTGYSVTDFLIEKYAGQKRIT